MTSQKIKKNKACPSKLQRSRGFVILYAVTLSAILLSIALGVASIALKEIKFGTSAKDTNEAFFAADTGLECALIYDKSVGSIFISPNSAPSMTCKNTTFLANESPLSFWTFDVSSLGSTGKGCAVVTVNKKEDGSTEIISKGYNINNGVGNDCAQDPNSIERELKTNY